MKLANRGIKTLIAALAAVGVAASVAGCGATAGPNSEPGSEPFTIVTFPGEVYVLEEVADEQGFFEDNGLQVKFLSPSSGASAANQFFLAGSIQAWPGNPAPVLGNAAKGYPVAVAGMLEGWIPWALQVSSGSDLASVEGSYAEKIRALEGKIIGVPGIGSLVHQLLLIAFQEAGLNPDSATFVGVGLTDAGIASLSKDRIDAYTTFSFVQANQVREQAEAEEYMKLTETDAPEAIQSFSNWAFSVPGKYAAENPKAAEGYAKALREAYEWITKNPEDAAAIVSKRDFKGERLDELTEAIKTLAAIPQAEGLKVSESALAAGIGALRSVDALPAAETGLSYTELVPEFARQ